MTPPKTNNFDLVRLFAATQVAVHHGSVHLGIEHSGSLFFLLSSLFPGVPIFFFISGFLISLSFERNPEILEYARNRLLRIYPALYVCFGVAVLSVFLSGYFSRVEVPLMALINWTVAQLSIVQFYNPEFMRDYGVGVLNGSLWTIVVELQFYVLVPLIYVGFLRPGISRRSQDLLLVGLLLLFLIVNQVYVSLGGEQSERFWYKVTGVSFAPWVYMFIVGVLCQRNFAPLQKLFAGRFLIVFAVYCVLAFLAREIFGWRFGNTLNPLTFTALAAVTFSAAFTANNLSDRLLKRNDISYGVYIYHMPVINALIAAGFSGSLWVFWSALLITIVLAFTSWRLVERPALKLKKRALYKHGSGAS